MIFHEQHGYSYTLQREVGPHGVLDNNQSDFQYLDFFLPFWNIRDLDRLAYNEQCDS
jgi:hypothetical protein